MKINLIIFFVISFIHVFGQNTSKTFLFVGSYTEGEPATGIYVYEFSPKNGSLKEVQIIDNIINPSFLTISPNGKYLYACTETKLGKDGSVSAFRIDTLNGQLTFINKQSAGGRNPVHVIVDKTNKYLINSNYTDASISIFECNENGALQPFSTFIEFEGSSIIKERQNKAHIHSANFSPDNQYIFAPDLGADKIRVLSMNNHQEWILVDSLEIQNKVGSGPRHFSFHPNQHFAYCIQELSGTVAAYTYKNGHLKLIDRYFSYSKRQETYGSSDIHISPDGKFLYASNRWHDENTISIFSINLLNGELTLIDHQPTFGDHPRSFVLSPSGNHLLVANQATGDIVVFQRDINSGLLTKTDTVLNINLPSSLKMIEYRY